MVGADVRQITKPFALKEGPKKHICVFEFFDLLYIHRRFASFIDFSVPMLGGALGWGQNRETHRFQWASSGVKKVKFVDIVRLIENLILARTW